MTRATILAAVALAATAATLTATAGAAHAGADCVPNLRPAVAAPLRTIRRPFEHRARGRFAVRVDNPTDCPVASRVGIKPLILPRQDVIVHGEHTHPAGDGKVMPTTFVDLDLAADASRTYVVQGRMPPLEWQTYRLTAIVDSGQVVAESNELDGIPDMVSMGYVGIALGNPPEPNDQIDFTTTLRGAASKQQGGVADTLGLHSRPGPPPFVLDSHDVGVRFLLADVATGKVYTLIYRHATACQPDCGPGLTCDTAHSVCVDADGNTVPEIDKEYYAIAWGNDVDELGRGVVTDIYWQAPRYVDADGVPFVPPGSYRFITVTDTWDRVPEFDETNNIDAVPFTLAPLEVVGHPNTWFVSTAAAPAAPAVAVPLLNSYSSDLQYTVSVSAGASWLQVTPSSGSLQIDQSAALSFSVERGALPPGEYEAEVTVTATGFEAYALVVPVRFSIYDVDAPAVSITPLLLDFETSIGVHPPPEAVTLSNSGTGGMLLEWEAYPNVGWISVAPPDGAGPPGYLDPVSLIIHPEGMQPGGPYTGTVSVFSNAPGGVRSITARLVVAPCESGWCSEGWTCNVSTHYCEPPQSCVDHDDCPIGQHCPPGAGTCEPSALCDVDGDCAFVFSPDGALTCDTVRGTCELASCAADPDCPVGSYCEETTALCPEAGTCFTDDDCFGWPYAFECDVERTSCQPAECAAHADCPAASYCSIFWGQCVSSAHCTADIDCYSHGMQCDETRDACMP
ncbi:MAG TPA: hypothetical protein VFD53_12135 [Ilumatobacter sp.]|nr:hypothetical protein [Ilumatobacter sp.]